MSTVLASVVFTVEELASLAQAVQTLQTLASKIQTAAPDAWASVTSDFKAAEQAWNQANVSAPVTAGGTVYNTDVGHVQDVTPHVESAPQPVPPEVQAIVEAGGQLPGMPVGFETAPPAVKPAEEEKPLSDTGESFRIDS